MLDKIALKISKAFDTTFTQGKFIAKMLLAMSVAFVTGMVAMLLMVGPVKYDTFEKYFINKYEADFRDFAKGNLDSVRIGRAIVQRAHDKEIKVSIIDTRFDKLDIAGAAGEGKRQ